MRAGKRVAVDIVLDRVREEKNQFLNRGDGDNVDTSSFRPVSSYELKNDSTLQSMFAEHGSARRRGALRRAAMERGRFTPPISPSVNAMGDDISRWRDILHYLNMRLQYAYSSSL